MNNDLLIGAVLLVAFVAPLIFLWRSIRKGSFVSKQFAFEEGALPRLEIRWMVHGSDRDVRNIDIFLDGKKIGEVFDRERLESGWHSTLSDGSILTIRWIQSFGGHELQIQRNGIDIPGKDERIVGYRAY